VGVLVLSKILFGGFRGRPGRHLYWRRRMMERWEQMTPEERERFRQATRGRCGPFGQPAAEPKL
jgi:Ca2+/H+ antiporter, TMEM165/GDT1 family